MGLFCDICPKGIVIKFKIWLTVRLKTREEAMEMFLSRAFQAACVNSKRENMAYLCNSDKCV